MCGSERNVREGRKLGSKFCKNCSGGVSNLGYRVTADWGGDVFGSLVTMFLITASLNHELEAINF